MFSVWTTQNYPKLGIPSNVPLSFSNLSATPPHLQHFLARPTLRLHPPKGQRTRLWSPPNLKESQGSGAGTSAHGQLSHVETEFHPTIEGLRPEPIEDSKDDHNQETSQMCD